MSPTIVKAYERQMQYFKTAPAVTQDDIWKDGRELGFADNAIKVIEKRYLARNEEGQVVETPKGMFYRIARALAQVEVDYGATAEQVKQWGEEFYGVLSRFEFTPAGRTLANAGGPTRVVANCIVLHFNDSMDGIFGTLRDASLLQQAGSGLGFAWHLLRPAGSTTVRSRGQASGPVSFLNAYNYAFGTIKQQCFAKGTRVVTRRGLIPIEEVQVGDKTYTEQGWKRVTELFNNGVRETLRLTLDTGLTIDLTPEHQVAVVEDNALALKQAQELTPDDTLLLKLGDDADSAQPYCSLQTVKYEKSKYTTNQLQDIVQPSALNESVAYLLGLYFADGCNTPYGIDLAISDDDGVEAKIVRFFQELFGTRAQVNHPPSEQCRKVRIISLWLKKYLERNGLLKQKAHSLAVPELVLRSPKGVQMAFIAGFFDGDEDNGKNYRLSTTSSIFAQQILRILLANGIGAKVATTVYQGAKAHWRPLYRLSIIGRESTERFFEKLQPWSWKIQKTEKTKDFGWTFPFHPVRDLDYRWKDLDGLHDGVRNTASHGMLTQIQARSALTVRQGIDWTGFLPAHVARLEPAGRQEVYDFEVEDAHMINAGLYTSNSRHGANMGVMRVDHPDILEFIDCKRKEGTIVNFNVSVGMTDEFMRAVKENKKEPWLCSWGGKKMKPRLIKRNNRGAYVSHEEVTLTAWDLMDKIVDAAWSNGEPGVLFPDAANRTNPVPALGRLEATNPCGEQWLHDGDVCNLGSINLAKFVADGEIDEGQLRHATAVATRMLDNVVDISDFPVEKVNTRFRDNRRVGLGIMGFADMLYQMNIGYDTPEGFATAKRVMHIVNDEAHKTSELLAKQKGTFPNWEKSIFGPDGQNRPQRNAALTTVAPTGSISMFFDCSSGVEPFFALAYYKTDGSGDQYPYFNSYFEQALRKRGLYSEELLKDIIETGSIQHRDDLPEDLRRTFVTAMDISAEDHIRMQAAFQAHTDNSISKTINFKNSATHEDVRAGYMLAWEAGCKGCTVYRDGSREEQVLNLNVRKEQGTRNKEQVGDGAAASATGQTIHVLEPRPRPEILRGTTYKLKTAYGNLYITINEDEHGPFEVFSQMGKAGGFFAANLEAICRMISLSLRSGVDIESVIRQLKGIRDPQPIWHKGEMILSLPDAIGQILEKHTKSSQSKLNLQWSENSAQLKEPVRLVLEKASGGFMDNGFAPACPDCGGVLAFQEGCARCQACGFSRCG